MHLPSSLSSSSVTVIVLVVLLVAAASASSAHSPKLKNKQQSVVLRQGFYSSDCTGKQMVPSEIKQKDCEPSVLEGGLNVQYQCNYYPSCVTVRDFLGQGCVPENQIRTPKLQPCGACQENFMYYCGVERGDKKEERKQFVQLLTFPDDACMWADAALYTVYPDNKCYDYEVCNDLDGCMWRSVIVSRESSCHKVRADYFSQTRYNMCGQWQATRYHTPGDCHAVPFEDESYTFRCKETNEQ